MSFLHPVLALLNPSGGGLLFVAMSLGLLMFFGAKKLPELTKALGQSMGEFKMGAEKGRRHLSSYGPNSYRPSSRLERWIWLGGMWVCLAIGVNGLSFYLEAVLTPTPHKHLLLSGIVMGFALWLSVGFACVFYRLANGYNKNQR